MEYPDFTRAFGPLTKLLEPWEVEELIRTGYVAVAVGKETPRRVFTLRVVAEESEIRETDFSQAKRPPWVKGPT